MCVGQTGDTILSLVKRSGLLQLCFWAGIGILLYAYLYAYLWIWMWRPVDHGSKLLISSPNEIAKTFLLIPLTLLIMPKAGEKERKRQRHKTAVHYIFYSTRNALEMLLDLPGKYTRGLILVILVIHHFQRP